jgi:predicted nucleic acid-binding protein
MGPVRVFLDANILFSAALGGRSFAVVWELAEASKIVLVTSRYCLAEAHSNLERKRPQAVHRLRALMKNVSQVPEAPERFEWSRRHVPEKDVAVLSAAVGCMADVLLTGDIADFGSLMKRTEFPIRVQTVRAFLTGGPVP